MTYAIESRPTDRYQNYCELIMTPRDTVSGFFSRRQETRQQVTSAGDPVWNLRISRIFLKS